MPRAERCGLLGFHRLLSGGTSRAPVYDFMWSGFVTDDAEQPPLAKQLEPAIEVGLERL